jgi:hypothetical protein
MVNEHEGVGSQNAGGLLRERLWAGVAVALLAAAGLLLWLAYTNAAFVAAALGVSAWFFDMRMQLKRRHDLVKLSGRNWIPRGELEEDEEEGQK